MDIVVADVIRFGTEETVRDKTGHMIYIHCANSGTFTGVDEMFFIKKWRDEINIYVIHAPRRRLT